MYIVKARLRRGRSPGGAQRIISVLGDIVERDTGVEHLHAKSEAGGVEAVFFLVEETARRAEATIVEVCLRAMRVARCHDWVLTQCMVTVVDQAEDLILAERPPGSGEPGPLPDHAASPAAWPRPGTEADSGKEIRSRCVGSGRALVPRPGTPVPSARMLRSMNERYVLGLIRQLETVSRADLARLSGLSKPVLSSVVADLEGLGLVQRAGLRQGGRGRAVTVFTLGRDAGWVLGVDVEEGIARWGVARIDGKVRVTRVSALAEHGTVEDLAGEIDLLCGQVDIARADLAWAVAGFSAPPCEATSGSSPAACHASVDRTLDRLFGPHYARRRGVEMEMLIRHRGGRRAAVRTVVYAVVGSSVDIGVIAEGVLYAPGAPVCAPGPPFGGVPDAVDRRCRDMPARAAARSDLERIVAARFQETAMPLHELMEAAGRGDPEARDVVSEMGALTARLLRSVLAIVHPGLVVFAGIMGTAPGFTDAVRSELADSAAGPVPQLEVAAAGGETVLDGCLIEASDLAWNQIFENLSAV